MEDRGENHGEHHARGPERRPLMLIVGCLLLLLLAGILMFVIMAINIRAEGGL